MASSTQFRSSCGAIINHWLEVVVEEGGLRAVRRRTCCEGRHDQGKSLLGKVYGGATPSLLGLGLHK